MGPGARHYRCGACRIAAEMEGEAAQLVPVAEDAVNAARQAAAALRGTPPELAVAHLHDLASAQLRAWLQQQRDAADFQVLPSVARRILWNADIRAFGIADCAQC